MHNLLALACFAGSLWQAAGQPTLLSSVPANGATGVSPTASVVFTFSTAMDTNATGTTFTAGGFPVITLPSWSSGDTVLTCTPMPSFPTPTQVTWFVFGQDTLGRQLNGTGFATGSFSTGSGGTGGSGTNATTTFSLDKIVFYDQTNSAAPTLDPTSPFGFEGLTSLSSNRTANSITLTLPNAAISNLTQNFGQHEDWFLFYATTVSNTWATTFPDGSYTFNVTAPTSNQMVSVQFPVMTQPNAPHVTNYTAAQAINPTQPFTLGWDPFVGGGTTDYVFVVVGGNVWQSPTFGAPGVLHGNATSVTIPANTLQANSNYTAEVGFYHAIVSSNANYATIVVRATVTQLGVATSGSAGPPAPILKNPAWSAGSFGFDIQTLTGQQITVVSSTNVHNALASWPVLITTNSPGSILHITDPHSSTNKALFYRARNGT